MDTLPPTLPSTDPAPIFHYRDRQYAAELIAAALVHLDFFSWLHSHAGATEEEICQQFGFASRPADVLLTLCRASGFLTTDAAGSNRLTLLGREYLVKGSPWYLGPYYAPIADTPVVQGFLKVLRTGQPDSSWTKSKSANWHEAMGDEEFARGFTAVMHCRGLTLGQHLARALTAPLADRRHVLDVGGGSGIYSSTLVAAHSHLTATILEQSPVDAIARGEVARLGFASRIQVASGNMFTAAWPTADVHLFSNVLHDWDFPEVRSLLKKSAESLPPGGLLIIHEAFLRDDKTGPLPVAEYSALLMHISQGKCYTPMEYGTLLSELGFTVGPYHATTGDRGFMTALKR